MNEYTREENIIDQTSSDENAVTIERVNVTDKQSEIFSEAIINIKANESKINGECHAEIDPTHLKYKILSERLKSKMQVSMSVTISPKFANVINP